jgi:hypothetical protein
MVQYVAYSNGLRHKDADPEDEEASFAPGATVNKGMFEPEEWNYHVLHGSIVRKGGPDDPEVLQANLAPDEPEEEEDPKDRRIRELEESLALYTGRVGTPAPGSHLNDLAQNEDEEDDDTQQSTSQQQRQSTAATTQQKQGSSTSSTSSGNK